MCCYSFLATEGQKRYTSIGIKNVYGEACLSNISVVAWCWKFRTGRGSSHVARRSGRRPWTFNIDNHKRAVDDAIRPKRCISIRMLSKVLERSTVSVRWRCAAGSFSLLQAAERGMSLKGIYSTWWSNGMLSWILKAILHYWHGKSGPSNWNFLIPPYVVESKQLAILWPMKCD